MDNNKMVWIGAIVGVGLFVFGQNTAHALRCNNTLVSEGSLRSEFISNCGTPTAQTSYDTIQYDNFQGTSWTVVIHFDANTDRATWIEENLL